MRPRTLAILLTGLLAAVVAAGCGDSDDGAAVSSRPAPSASLFPAAEGRDVVKFLESTAKAQGPVVSPAAKAFRVGENRFPFGVFTTGREPIVDAQVALYASHGPKGKVVGPFPARIDDVTTEARFRAKSTLDDPAAAQVIYVTEMPFNAKGEWRVGALIRSGDTLQGSVMPSVEAAASDDVPAVGDKAPKIHTPTAADVGGDLSKIDTRQPPDDMHSADFADVVGKKPVLLVFATPALCVSRTCGPVVDVAEQVKQTSGDGVEFIHMEVYRDNDRNKGLRPQLRAFRLPSEPWAFAIGRDGRVVATLEGAWSVEELTQAVEKARG